MKCNLDSIISILHQVESCETNDSIVFTNGVVYNGKYYPIKDEKEFAIIYTNILCIRDYGLADVRVLQKGLAIALDRITPKGSRFLVKALILKAIDRGYFSETAIAKAGELKQHTVNCYLEQLSNEQFILAPKGFPITEAGKHEYQSCVLKSKGKEALEDPSYLVEESNMTEHRTIKTDAYYEQSGNIGIGHMSGGEIKGNAKVAGVINEAEERDLAEAAAEIQALIRQLEQDNPTNTTTEQMVVATQAIEQIESNPTWKQKAIAAFKQGSLNVIETHPIGTFIIGAIEGWQKQQAK
ncbi:hypothetical protein H1P_2830012 [Hyella patelloides LEGE 07179]|uniref:Uncharacterized protein n=1 Tax=Hyella patelloides LEGE 07179 TaxID=945734 RepID=A0A563VTM9_9CYAN|nr:hypothetical protein [Hyella patelloides]VEP14744.1 hypothetical protein H1P_2830012 [Hyella patelloides LEGE 07179]